MAPRLLQTHSEKVGPKAVRDDKSPSIELSLGIDAPSSKPLTSQNIWSSGFRGVQLQNLMDLEPGRCRRTDGKKWRCRRDVLPDKKYCERHINRGCQRSRKPVEVSKSISEVKPTTSNSNSSIKVLADHQPTTKTSATSSKKFNTRNQSNVLIKNDLSARVTSFNPSNSSNQSLKIKKSSPGCGSNGEAPEFNFSPKSVLQHVVPGCGTKSNDQGSTLVEAELQRCKRTDGKKWRCSKEVIADQKYCGQHMNRGAKRLDNTDNGQNVNTSLTISAGTSHQRPANDGNHSNAISSSSSSDEETDSDGVNSSNSSSSSSKDENDSDGESGNSSSSSEATTISI